MPAQRDIRLVFVAALALIACGCSLVLAFDPDLNPCNNDKECFQGFTCLVNSCVQDRSLSEGETCNLDLQCENNLKCPPGPFVCSRECGEEDFFRSSTKCFDTSFFCKPLRDADDVVVGGACVPSECDVEADCTEDSGAGICVTITDNARACLPFCQISLWSTLALPSDYKDNCVGDLYCQPVGQPANAKLVCLPTSSSAQGEGSICHPITNPCAAGLACDVDGFCRAHCDPDDVFAKCVTASLICCTQNTMCSGAERFGLCEDDCAGNGCP